MANISRRDLLKGLAVSAFTAAAGRGAPWLGNEALDFLVVGDSIIWGQGLEEKDKFYTLTTDWLRSLGRDVRLKLKAHSGSSLKFHPEEAAAYRKISRDETFYYKPEVNVGFPSTWKQLEIAANEYKAEGKSRGADLIMLTGGITDITVRKVLDPFRDKDLLPPLIRKYCRDHMFDVIDLGATNNPDALIAVIGYFPMISPSTPSSKLLNHWLESMDVPDIFKPLLNNPLMRPLFFKRLKNKGIIRSRIWYTESNKYLAEAVDKLNAKYGKTRAVFIKSPITEVTSLETPETLLFRMNKNGSVEDPLFLSRSADCNEALPRLKKETGIDYPVRLCEIAAVGHPNAAGSRAYAEVIKTALAPYFAGHAS